VGHDDDRGSPTRQVLWEIYVRAVDRQNQLRTGLDGRADLGGIERVDAQPQTGRDELAHNVSECGKGDARHAPDVDHVGAGAVEVLRGIIERPAREARRIVDFGEDLDVPRAILARGGGAPEVARNFAQVLRSFLDTDRELLGNRVQITLAKAWNQDQVGAIRHLERPRD